MATKANSQKTYVAQSANVRRARRVSERECERRHAEREETNNPRSQKAFYNRLVLFTTRRSLSVCECKTKATQR